MDKNDFDKYIQEMIKMSKKASLSTQEAAPTASVSEQTESTPSEMVGTGYILVNVTTIQGLYPIPNAHITIFKGNIEAMEKIKESTTDQSGKTEIIPLPAPSSELAQDSDNTTLPYATYNILTEVDGFLPAINYDAAVFDGVTSIQNVNLIPSTPYNEGDTDIYIEDNNYEL